MWLHQNFLSEKWCQDFSSGLVVKDSALSMLWLVFDPWPGKDLIAMGAAKKKKKKKKEEKKKKKKKKSKQTKLEIKKGIKGAL